VLLPGLMSCPPPKKFSADALDCKMLKGQVHCFSLQVAMNRYFLLNPEKKWCSLVVFEKNAKKRTLIPKNDVTERKALL